MEDSRLFLTPAELHELSGYKAHRTQCRWLELNQFRFLMDRCGRPKVLRSVLDARLGATDRRDSDPPVRLIVTDCTVRPDYSALNKSPAHTTFLRRT